MSLAMFAAVLLVGGQAATAMPPVSVGHKDGLQFKGGPYAGLSIGMVTTPDGKRFRGLMPSRPEVSPIAAKSRAAISAFVAGHADPGSEPLAAYLRKNAKLVICKQQGAPCQVSLSTPLTFGEAVQANSPFALDARRVRIEWVYGTALYYVTELTLKGGKIAYARTQPAWLPLEFRKAR